MDSLINQLNDNQELNSPLIHELDEELLHALSPEIAEHFLIQTNLLLQQTDEILLLTQQFLQILD